MYYKTIIFDLDNTLLNFDLCERKAEIFHHALSRLNLTSAEVIYVGDSLKHDYAGATQVKMDFCYYNRKNQNLPQEVKPKFMISELLNLLELFN